jgi:hypothetical protein
LLKKESKSVSEKCHRLITLVVPKEIKRFAEHYFICKVE